MKRNDRCERTGILGGPVFYAAEKIKDGYERADGKHFNMSCIPSKALSGGNGLPDGESIDSLELNVKLKNNTTTNMMFGYTLEGGDSITAPIVKVNGTITLKIVDGSPTFEIQ